MPSTARWTLLRTGLLAVPAIGAAFTLALIVWAAGGGEALDLTAFGFALWATSPYVLLALAGPRLRRPARQWVVLLGDVVLTGGAIWIYIVGFVIETDAQSALLFVFVPLYQWVGCGVVFALAGLAALLSGARER